MALRAFSAAISDSNVTKPKPLGLEVLGSMTNLAITPEDNLVGQKSELELQFTERKRNKA